MNVLITSAGRRVSLLKAFQEAVHPRGGRVFAGDIDPLAPALLASDEALRLPSLANPGYIDAVLALVDAHGIGLVVPTIDTELAILAKSVHRFKARGCRALISSEQMVKICGDKWLTFKFFAENGIRTPRTWLPEDMEPKNLPDGLYVKPRNGSASQNTHRTNFKSLCSVLEITPNPVVQEDVSAPEITIDALLDFQGQPVYYVPRLRIKTVGGESVQGVTIPDDCIREAVTLALGILGAAGARGPITLQAFLTDCGPTFSEVNPRFGGGFPLTHFAGGCYPEWIVRMLGGENVRPVPGDYRRGAYMTRYNTECFMEQPLWQ